MGTKYNWHKIADREEDIKFTAGDVAEVEIEGTTICIGRWPGGARYGFSGICPHAGAPMADGYTSGECTVVCPVHSLKFNLKNNGRDVNGEGYKLKVYPVETREDGIYVGVEEAGGFFKKWF